MSASLKKVRQRRDLRFPGSKVLPAVLTDELPHRHFDVVIECTGQAEGFDIARRALRPRGVLVVKSTYTGRFDLDMSSVVVDEITVIGSRCGPFPPALRHLADGNVDPQPLVGGRFPLSEGLSAMDHARLPGALKVLLKIGKFPT